MSHIVPTPPEAINAGPPPAVPAGWYADPQSSDMLRWWDGQSWTVRLMPSNNSSLPDARTVSGVPVSTMAGWHPDPYGTGKLRLWDGMSWTQKLIMPGSMPGQESYYNSTPLQRTTSNIPAEIGFSLGICAAFLCAIPWVGPIISLGALFISLAGWSMHTAQNKRGSKVRAIIGLCLGVIYFFVGLLMIYTPYYN